MKDPKGHPARWKKPDRQINLDVAKVEDAVDPRRQSCLKMVWVVFQKAELLQLPDIDIQRDVLLDLER